MKKISSKIGDSEICAGIIGKIGYSASLFKNEKKVLRASALAQQHTGAAICIHPGKRDEIVLEIIEILRDSGAYLYIKQ